MLTRRNLLKAVPALGVLSLLPSFASSTEPIKEDLGKIKDVWVNTQNGQIVEEGWMKGYRMPDDRDSVEVLYTRGIKVFKHIDRIHYDGSPNYWCGVTTIDDIAKQLEKHPDYVIVEGCRWDLFSTGIYCEEGKVATLNQN